MHNKDEFKDDEKQPGTGKITFGEARKIAEEVFKEEYTSGLIVGLCIGAAFGVALAVVAHNS